MDELLRWMDQLLKTLLYDQSPWDRGVIELATPGSTVRQVSALGHVSSPGLIGIDCVKQPGSDRYLSYIFSLYVKNLSFCVVIKDLRIGQVHFIAL